MCPLSSILNIPSRPVLRHPPQRPVLDSLSYTAVFSACISEGSHFSSVLLANIFHRQTACSKCFEKSTVCFWRAPSQDVLLQSEESCRCTLRFSSFFLFLSVSVILSSLSTECLDLVTVGRKAKICGECAWDLLARYMYQPNQGRNKTSWMYQHHFWSASHTSVLFTVHWER